jgi:hypothetical protein
VTTDYNQDSQSFFINILKFLKWNSSSRNVNNVSNHWLWLRFPSLILIFTCLKTEDELLKKVLKRGIDEKNANLMLITRFLSTIYHEVINKLLTIFNNFKLKKTPLLIIFYSKCWFFNKKWQLFK